MEYYYRLYMVFFYFVSGLGSRIVWKKNLQSMRVLENGTRSLLIVTSSSIMNMVVDNIRNHNYEGFRIVGLAVIDQDLVGESVGEIDIVANQDNATDFVCRKWVDEVFINLPDELPLCEDLINQFVEMGVAVHLKLAKVSNLSGKKQFVERMGPYTVLTTCVNLATSRQLFVKRLMDIIGGLVGCIVTGVLYVCVAPFVYAKSPGPIFFSQIRVGKNGKRFKLYKFRSMYLDAEEQKKELMEQNRVSDGLMFKLDYDPRIIVLTSSKF